MILFIAHRQNNLKKINQKQNSNFNGIEIDVRTNSKNIIINHDPFKKSLIFNKNLKILKKYHLYTMVYIINLKIILVHL